jgi:hypothetical protein
MLQPVPVPRLYLDTSVIGGYFDKEWERPTQELWRQAEQGFYRLYASVVTAREIQHAPVPVQTGFNAVNLLQGYPAIRIVSPMELIYGNEEQEL